MKKFILISIALLSIGLESRACGYWGNEHNNYLFSVFRRELMNSDLFSERVNAEWKAYSNGAIDSYTGYSHDAGKYNYELLEQIAKNRGDKEMLEYMSHLNIYLKICEQLRETWSYPTKEELAVRQQQFAAMKAAAKSHLGGKMHAQWALLLMRANMQTGAFAENIRLWESEFSHLPASVYRDMMANLYAGALYRTGKVVDACEEFARQGDMLSVRWAMRKDRSLKGIQQYYEERHDTPLLHFLIQDFVNNAQETIDNDGDTDWLAEINSRLIQKVEVNAFIAFANKVVANKGTESEALWLGAIGALQYLMGDASTAMETLARAQDASGTQRMRDNARAIRMIASAAVEPSGKKYDKWMTGELQWLASAMRAETGIDQKNEYELQYNHYYDIFDRLVHRGLVPRYKKEGRDGLVYGLMRMTEHPEYMTNITLNREEDSWNPEYSRESFYSLHNASVDKVKSIREWVNSKSGNDLDSYVRSNAHADAMLMDDLTGTTYLRAGDYSRALPYLEKVTPSFVEGQNVCWYLKNKDWHKDRWMGKQKVPEDIVTEVSHTVTLDYNPKARYCKEMIDLEKRYSKARGEERCQLAYQLASQMYQSSGWGDCWALTDYSWSSTNFEDSTHIAENSRFYTRCIELLNESKRSTNIDLRQKSIYALAFIPLEPWYKMEWSEKVSNFIYRPLPMTRQYRAMAELSDFYDKNPVADYVRKCDVLKAFRENR